MVAKINPVKRTEALPILSASHPESKLVNIPPKVQAVSIRLISGSLTFNPSESLMKSRKTWFMHDVPITIIMSDRRNHL